MRKVREINTFISTFFFQFVQLFWLSVSTQNASLYFQSKFFKRRQLAKLSLLAVFVFINFHFLGGMEENPRHLSIKDKYVYGCIGRTKWLQYYHINIFQRYFEGLLYSIIPSIIIVFLNATMTIVFKVKEPDIAAESRSRNSSYSDSSRSRLSSSASERSRAASVGKRPIEVMGMNSLKRSPIAAVYGKPYVTHHVITAQELSIISEVPSSLEGLIDNRTLNSRSKTQVQLDRLTLMTLVLSLTFVILTAPLGILYLYGIAHPSLGEAGNLYGIPHTELGVEDELHAARLFFFGHIANMFANLNHCCNFLLYCMMGSAFRKELLSMCRRLCRVNRDHVISV